MCFSCIGQFKQQTEQNFKKKYDYEECIAMCIKIEYASSFSIFEYQFNDMVYKVHCPYSFVYRASIRPGYKYPILIDKNNPNKNYWVLYDKPILQETNIVYEAPAIISMAFKSNELAQVKYEIHIASPDGIQSYKRDEYLPIEYLSICKQIKKEKKNIMVNVYPFIEYGTNESVNISFINRESLR